MFGRLQVTQNANIQSLYKKKKTDVELLEDLEHENERKRIKHEQEVAKEGQAHKSESYGDTCKNILMNISPIIREVVYGKYEEYFYFFIMSSCILSGILAGMSTYPLSSEISNIIGILNMVVLAVFILEIVLKVIAAGRQPLDYFKDPIHGRWNSFDLIVTVVSVPGVAGRASAVVRILRLFRILEQFQKINAMKAIVMGLLAGMKSIGYILLLLFLVFYLYAIIGISSFQENNPFYFNSILLSLVALFRGMTLENWEVMMFTDVYGCDVYDGGLYVAPWEYLGVNETKSPGTEWEGVSKLYRCLHPKKSSFLAPAFWVSFIVISSFVVLALFIGVITLHMQDSINIVRIEKEEELRKKRLAQQLEDLKNIKVANTVLNLINRVNDSRIDRSRKARKERQQLGILEPHHNSTRRPGIFVSLSRKVSSFRFGSTNESSRSFSRSGSVLGSQASPNPDISTATTPRVIDASHYGTPERMHPRAIASILDSAKLSTVEEIAFSRQQSMNLSDQSTPGKKNLSDRNLLPAAATPASVESVAPTMPSMKRIASSKKLGSDRKMKLPNSFNSELSLSELVKTTTLAPSVAQNPYLLTLRRGVGQAATVQTANNDENASLLTNDRGDLSSRLVDGSSHRDEAIVEDDEDEKEEEENMKIKVASSSKLRKINEMTGLLIEAWHGASYAQQHNDEMMQSLSSFGKRLRFWKQYASNILESSIFHFCVTSLILFSSILVGIELDLAVDSPSMQHAFNGLEIFIGSLFCIELSIRFLAEELDLIAFFSSPWNIFDFGVIITSLVPGSSNIVLLFRLFRIFRLLKLLRMFPQLQTIVQALFSGLASIRYVGTIIGFVFYVFALVGYLLFHENDPQHFATLDAGLVTLLAVITLDNWGDIMYGNIFGCERFPSPGSGDDSTCHHSKPTGFLAAAYFIIFIIFGSFVLLTLFIGVVTTAMEAASLEKQKLLRMEKKCDELVEKKILDQATLDLYKRVFSILDTDGSGTIEVSEIQMGLNCVKLQPTTHELCGWIEAAGLNPSEGSYGIYDFIIFMMAMKKRNARERFKEAIRKTYKRNNRNKTFVTPPSEVKAKPVNKMKNIISMFGKMGAHRQVAVTNDSEDGGAKAAELEEPLQTEPIGNFTLPKTPVFRAPGVMTALRGFGRVASAPTGPISSQVEHQQEPLSAHPASNSAKQALHAAINGFKIKPGKSPAIIEMIATASAVSNTDVHQLSNAVQQSHDIANLEHHETIPVNILEGSAGPDDIVKILPATIDAVGAEASRVASEGNDNSNGEHKVSRQSSNSSQFHDALQAAEMMLKQFDSKKSLNKQQTYDSEINSLESSVDSSFARNFVGDSTSTESISHNQSMQSAANDPSIAKGNGETNVSDTGNNFGPLPATRGSFFVPQAEQSPANVRSTKANMQYLVRSIVAI